MKRLYSIFIVSWFICCLSLSAATITIGSNTYNIDTLQHFQVGPGTYYTELKLLTNSNVRLDVYFLKADITNPYIEYHYGLGNDSIVKTERPTKYANRKTTGNASYFAGTNGGFFRVTEALDSIGVSTLGQPSGTTMLDGQIALITSYNKSLAFTADNIPVMGLSAFSGKVKNDTVSYKISRINTIRKDNEIVLYNEHKGKTTHSNNKGTEVVVSLVEPNTWGVNKDIKVKVEAIYKDKGNNAIPKGKAILSGSGNKQAFINSLSINDELTVNLGLTINDTLAYDLKEITSSGRYEIMLYNGVLSDDNWNEWHPRTGMGYSQDKKYVIQCVVDGRGVSRGCTTYELAQLMVSAGAYNAINLDGGGSSCLFVSAFGPMNKTSDGSERAVGDNVCIVAKCPNDTVISEIQAYNTTIKLPKYGVYMPRVLGYNRYGILLNKDIKENLVLSCTPEVGHIAADGRFVASGTQSGKLTITYNDTVSTTVDIVLVSEAEIAIRLDSVLISEKRPYNIEVQSIIGKDTLEVLPTALTWKSRNVSVCAIEDGKIKGIENGKTWVVGNLGTFSDSLIVTVENVEHSPYIHDDFSNADNWAITAQANWNTVLSADNVPASWSHGGALNYTYATNRAPSIKLTHEKKLYSLPDSMKIYLNSGAIAISKVYVGLRANCDTKVTQAEFLDIPSNSDQECIIDFSKLFNTEDFAIYPFSLDYITFYIKAGSQTVGTAYALALKDITLYYDGVEVGLNATHVNTSLIIYPNPVTNGEARVKLDLQKAEKVTMEVINLQGQIVKRTNLGNITNEAILPLQNIPTGSYFVRLIQENKTNVVKLIIK
ncbi:MAG: phosphodiester glycosidase family protein [Paludibacteraceae bacterium]|nr:phosphodiester glycosidase family protein [Paludibacteraceae bacterium]